jgi:hypothetical protein
MDQPVDDDDVVEAVRRAVAWSNDVEAVKAWTLAMSQPYHRDRPVEDNHADPDVVARLAAEVAASSRRLCRDCGAIYPVVGPPCLKIYFRRCDACRRRRADERNHAGE